MKITEDVRRFADENGLNDDNEAISAGMAQKAKGVSGLWCRTIFRSVF